MLWRVFEIEAVQRSVELRGRGCDIGCGDGTLARTLFSVYEPHPALVGVEPDPADCAAARASRVYGATHCVSGDAIPEADASFDFVFSNSTLEHIPVLEPVLREAARILRPAGVFVFTVPSEQFHRCLAGSRVLARRARARGIGYEELIDQRLQHHRYPTPAQWSAMLRPAGFATERFVRYFPRDAVRAWERLSNITGGVAHELFGARRTTRQIQHGLGIAHRGRLLAPVIALVSRLAARGALHAEVRDGEPSGGLLVIATRA